MPSDVDGSTPNNFESDIESAEEALRYGRSFNIIHQSWIISSIFSQSWIAAETLNWGGGTDAGDLRGRPDPGRVALVSGRRCGIGPSVAGHRGRFRGR